MSELGCFLGAVREVGGWTFDELRLLDRLSADLRAGIGVVHATQGVSEHGEPWVKVWAMDGSRLVDVARVQGRVVVNQLADEVIGQGGDLRALLDRCSFGEGNTTRTPPATTLAVLLLADFMVASPPSGGFHDSTLPAGGVDRGRLAPVTADAGRSLPELTRTAETASASAFRIHGRADWQDSFVAALALALPLMSELRNSSEAPDPQPSWLRSDVHDRGRSTSAESEVDDLGIGKAAEAGANGSVGVKHVHDLAAEGGRGDAPAGRILASDQNFAAHRFQDGVSMPAALTQGRDQRGHVASELSGALGDATTHPGIPASEHHAAAATSAEGEELAVGENKLADASVGSAQGAHKSAAWHDAQALVPVDARVPLVTRVEDSTLSPSHQTTVAYHEPDLAHLDVSVVSANSNDDDVQAPLPPESQEPPIEVDPQLVLAMASELIDLTQGIMPDAQLPIDPAIPPIGPITDLPPIVVGEGGAAFAVGSAEWLAMFDDSAATWLPDGPPHVSVEPPPPPMLDILETMRADDPYAFP